MKGLVPINNPNTIYLVIKHGCLCQESKIMRDGYDPIELADRDNPGVTYFKYIKPWAGVEAMVADIKFRDEVYGGIPYISWRIHLQADGPPMVLDLPLNSNVGDRFMRTAENIDFTKPVEFRAWQERDSKKIAIMIAQDGKNVPQLYTKDHPGDCPPARQRFDKTWDFEAQKEFLYQRMIEVVIPRVHAANGTTAEAAPASEHPADPFVPQSRTESPQERPQSSAPADDPFARRPAPQGVATGSAGPITTATLDTLKAIATKRSDLDFQEIANKLYQRNVQDLTEGQGVAMMKYVEML